MRIDVYHHSGDDVMADVQDTLERIERVGLFALSELREVKEMAEKLGVEVQETIAAFDALRDAVSSKLELLIVTIGELRDQLASGGLTANEESAGAELLDGVQTEMAALKAAVEATPVGPLVVPPDKAA
jgi:hypothetical protein